jgi:hypothetical protein
MFRAASIVLGLLVTLSVAGASEPAGVSVRDVAPMTTWTLTAAGETWRCERARGDALLVWRSQRLPAERWAIASAGFDLDGDGTLEQVFAGWEGRRCRVWIREGEHLRRLPGWHGFRTRLTDLDRDGVAELVTRDETFRGWRGASEADGVSVEVVLKRTRSSRLWRLAPCLRGVTRPNARVLRERGRLLGRAWRVARSVPARSPRRVAAPAFASSSSTSPRKRPPTPAEAERALTGALLELYAAGHGTLSKALLAAAWPSRRPGRDAFWRAFQAQLARSPYLRPSAR